MRDRDGVATSLSIWGGLWEESLELRPIGWAAAANHGGIAVEVLR
jgi:hypothetical protein